jgi:hypothetical protein
MHVEDTSAFPPSVTDVATSIPAFIGYTETAHRGTESLLGRPTKIGSMKEYEALFGLPHADSIAISVAEDGAGGFTVTDFPDPPITYRLYHGVRMYFDNGGAQCCVVSVGGYGEGVTLEATGSAGGLGLLGGLEALALEEEPTLVVIPDAVQLPAAGYAALARAVFLQCGAVKNRFAIFDVHDGGMPLDADARNAARSHFGTSHLSRGAAYYPFLRTALHPYVADDEANVIVTLKGAEALLSTLASSDANLHNFVKAQIDRKLLVLPPSGAVAGVYAAVDSARGVWKAPADVPLADVVEPVVKLTDLQQEAFVADATDGRSINVLRAFPGKGTLIRGARTLAGNDSEWRYVSVSRFFSMVEASVEQSTRFAVFEPNDAPTWVKVRCTVEDYFTGKWRQGALAGATPKDAFFVKCGLGSTMTGQDILDGRLIVEIGMAVLRPAEFFAFRVVHTVQKA